VIYDPSHDPIMKKKREYHLKEFKRETLILEIHIVIGISVAIFLLYFLLVPRPVSYEYLLGFVIAVILILLAMGTLYLPIKGKYKIKSQKIILLKDGIFYDKQYRPSDLPNPLFIPYKDITDISIDTLKSGRRVINIELQGKSAEIRDDIKEWVSILEDCVPDLDEFYEILKEQIERNRNE